MKITSRSGSALVVTLLVVGLLLAVTLAFVTMVRMELRTVANHHEHLLARANAKLGAEIAIGRLQELVGRDGRVTVPSSLYAAAQGQDRWTGAWDAGSKNFLGWFVSGANVNPTDSVPSAPGSSPIWIVERGNRIAYGVVVPSVATDKGSYAFWVSDENTKAGLPPADQRPLIDFSQRRAAAWGGYTTVRTPGAEGRQRIALQRVSVSPAMPLLGDVVTPAVMQSTEGQAKLKRMVSREQIPLVGPVNPGQDWFHDLTLFSRSLHVDVPGDRLRFDFNPIEIPSGFPGNGRVEGGERFFDQRGGWLSISGDTSPFFARTTPSELLSTEVSIRFSVFARPPTGGATQTPLVVRYQIQAESWNASHMQLGFHIQATSLALRFRGLPPLTVSGVDAGGTPFTLPPIDLEALVSRVNTTDALGASVTAEVVHQVEFKPTSTSFGSLVYRPGQFRLGVTSDPGPNHAEKDKKLKGRVRRIFVVRDSEYGDEGWIEHVFIDRMVPATANNLNVAVGGADSMLVYVSTSRNLYEYYFGRDDLDYVVQEFRPHPSFQAGSETKPREDESFVFGFGVELRKNMQELLGVQGLRIVKYTPEMFEPIGSVDTYSRDPFANVNPIFQTSDGQDSFYRTSEGLSVYDGFVDAPISVGGLRNIRLLEDQRIGSPWPLGAPALAKPSDNWVFDRGFYSTIPYSKLQGASASVPYTTEDLAGRRFVNPYLELYEDENLPMAPEHESGRKTEVGLGDVREAALHLWIQNGFNLNSLNPRAWESFFRSHRLKGWQYAGGTKDLESVFFRFPGSAQNAGVVYTEAELRNLDEEEIRQMAFLQPFRGLLTTGGVNEPRELAEKLVARLRARGRPLFSIQEFVDEGILADLLNPDKPGAVSSINLPFAAYKNAPIYLSQADIIEALAPLATVRGDTFVVRGYGESPASAGGAAKAYCELIVQRVPTPVVVPEGLVTMEDYRNVKRTQWHTLSAAGHPFGRRFTVIGFRWLTQDEI